jgi:hypothetical protein
MRHTTPAGDRQVQRIAPLRSSRRRGRNVAQRPPQSPAAVHFLHRCSDLFEQPLGHPSALRISVPLSAILPAGLLQRH